MLTLLIDAICNLCCGKRSLKETNLINKMINDHIEDLSAYELEQLQGAITKKTKTFNCCY